MSELEKQLRKTISLAEKKGLVLAVEFLRGFIEKGKVINAKQRINTQVRKEVRCNRDLPSLRG
jgi:hypothetical protein